MENGEIPENANERKFFPLLFIPPNLAIFKDHWLLFVELLLKFLFFTLLCDIQIALVPKQILLENLTLAKDALIKKFVLLLLKALTQVLSLSLARALISLFFFSILT